MKVEISRVFATPKRSGVVKLGEMIQFDEFFFQVAWFNHQLEVAFCLEV